MSAQADTHVGPYVDAIGALHVAIAQDGEDDVVTIRKDVGRHVDGLADGAFDGKPTRVDLWNNVLDDDAGVGSRESVVDSRCSRTTLEYRLRTTDYRLPTAD